LKNGVGEGFINNQGGLSSWLGGFQWSGSAGGVVVVCVGGGGAETYLFHSHDTLY
jgi:hypothetical protein